MNYKETVDALFTRRPKPIGSLEGVSSALAELGNPHQTFPSIHVAGTNGKGQVAVKVARALEKGGYRVGLFISPHLFEYRERITINREEIPEEKIVQYDRELTNFMHERGLELNFFESSTCFGFRYFSEEKVDVAVIEVGLGGRGDSTNVLSPLLSVITSISHDHHDFLGGTLEEIAHAKAGIIKQNTPVVIGPRAKMPQVFEEAEKKNAPIRVIERQSCFYDTENQVTAYEALQIVSEKFPLSRDAIDAGIRESLPCRFEKRGRVIYDVAHNPDGMARLSHALEHLYPNRQFRFLVGMGRNKDIRGNLTTIAPKVSHIHFVRGDHIDSATPEELAAVWQEISKGGFSIEEDLAKGAKRAKAATPKGEILVVCGSFHIMAQSYT